MRVRVRVRSPAHLKIIIWPPHLSTRSNILKNQPNRLIFEGVMAKTILNSMYWTNSEGARAGAVTCTPQNYCLTTPPFYQGQHIKKSAKLVDFWRSYGQNHFKFYVLNQLCGCACGCGHLHTSKLLFDHPTFLPGTTYQKISQIGWFLKELWPKIFFPWK